MEGAAIEVAVLVMALVGFDWLLVLFSVLVLLQEGPFDYRLPLSCCIGDTDREYLSKRACRFHCNVAAQGSI